MIKFNLSHLQTAFVLNIPFQVSMIPYPQPQSLTINNELFDMLRVWQTAIEILMTIRANTVNLIKPFETIFDESSSNFSESALRSSLYFSIFLRHL